MAGMQNVLKSQKAGYTYIRLPGSLHEFIGKGRCSEQYKQARQLEDYCDCQEVAKRRKIALSPLLGDVFEMWRNLRANIPDEYQQDVAKRSLEALSEVILAANLLDPRYQGINMCPADVQPATKYIQEVNPDSGKELTKYLASHPLT